MNDRAEHRQYDVVLIDMGSVFGAAWHSSADDEVSAARARTVASVRSIARAHEHVAVCCDSRRNWRKELEPSHKEQREKKPESYYAELDRSKEELRRDGLVVWECDGFEADDVIATAAKEAVASGFRVLIHSADKDLTQLVRDDRGDTEGTVTVFSPVSNRHFREADVLDKFGVPPSQMRDWLALVGDSGDNVKGVPGVGARRASAMLKTFGTVESAIAAIGTPRQKDIGGRAIQDALKQNLPALALAQKLVSLRTDAPIDFGELFATREVRPLVEVNENDIDSDSDLDDVLGAPAFKVEPPLQVSTAPENAPPNAVRPVPQTVAATPASVEQSQQAQASATVSRVAPNGADSGQLHQGIVVATPYEQQLEPRSPASAMTLAKWLVNSRLYSRFPNEEAVFAVIVRGREMGLGALTALDTFHIIEGKPALHAHLIVARAKRHPDCEYFRMVSSSATKAVFETKSRANPDKTVLEYTLEEAKLCGLCPQEPRVKPVFNDKGRDVRNQWEKRPAEMLRKTCAVQLSRVEYPDAALGLYAVEELEESA